MSLEKTFATIDELKSKLDALLPMSTEDATSLWQKLRLEWNYNSNHMEGNTLTYGETQLLLIHDRTTGDHKKREYDEMQAHDVAVHVIKDWAADNERDISEADIRELNKIILVKPFWKEALTYDGQNTRRQIKVGEYKEHPNSVRLANGEMFHYATPEETPKLMQELMDWYRNFNGHPVQLAADFHYKFIRIHPFDDGNGRIARLLANYVLMRNGYQPIVIKSAAKDQYLAALQKADAGDIDAFREYIAQRCGETLSLATLAATGKSIEEEDDLDKKLSLLNQKIEQLDKSNEINTELSQKTLLNIYKKWLGDLLLEIIKTAQKFNPLYTEPKHLIYCVPNGHDLNHQFSVEKPESILNAIGDKIENLQEQIKELKIILNLDYGPFKKGGVNSFGCVYIFNFKFERFKYEIEFPMGGSDAGQNFKVWHEHLLNRNITKAEQKEMVNHVGNLLYDHIERNLNDRGIK